MKDFAELLYLCGINLQRPGFRCSGKLTPEERNRAANECYECVYQSPNPGDAHISCMNPDPDMCGNAHGIDRGWFFYPLSFDPTWKERFCANFRSKYDKKNDG